MQERAAEMERRMADEVERARRSLGAELVPYGAYESTTLTVEGDDEARSETVSIPIERRRRRA